VHAKEQDRPDVKEARACWLEQFKDVKLTQFVFLDEFGAATNMTRTHARAPRGVRAACQTPQGHWQILSTIAAMTVQGIVCSASFDGATDTELFVTFVREALVPTLVPGQVVVLDNLSAHRSPQAAHLIEQTGCRLLRLPPYSPDLNPIEMAISKVKAYLRSLECRTVNGLLDGITLALSSVSVLDAQHFIEHCGYATEWRNPL
jgi:transposase